MLRFDAPSEMSIDQTTGYTLAENSTVALNEDSEYISGCATCVEYPAGDRSKYYIWGVGSSGHKLEGLSWSCFDSAQKPQALQSVSSLCNDIFVSARAY